eukprot:1760100-Amphidinium_carterae.1
MVMKPILEETQDRVAEYASVEIEWIGYCLTLHSQGCCKGCDDETTLGSAAGRIQQCECRSKLNPGRKGLDSRSTWGTTPPERPKLPLTSGRRPESGSRSACAPENMEAD